MDPNTPYASTFSYVSMRAADAVHAGFFLGLGLFLFNLCLLVVGGVAWALLMCFGIAAVGGAAGG